MKNFVDKLHNEKTLFFLILGIGILTNVVMLGKVPGGINQDEAYAGYEAYSLIHYGMDSHGYVNPVYFISWGSGMNVLYSYLSIPFIALWGLNAVSIRLVQAISTIVLMIFAYKLVERISGSKCALWTLFFLTIMPWRIMMSRWGLESNLAPTFLVIAWYFMVKVIDNNLYLILAFSFYGLSLYCYAPLWILVPFMLVMQLFWLGINKKNKTECSFCGIDMYTCNFSVAINSFCVCSIWIYF